VGDGKFIKYIICVPKIFVIDEVLTKLLEKFNGAVFFASYGIYSYLCSYGG